MPITINTIRLLVNNSLYLAPLSLLNDPFEGEFKFKKLESIPSVDYIRENMHGVNLKSGSITEDEFYSQLKTLLGQFIDEHYGLTCFSEVNNSTLMWSHYADSHKGICIEFDSDLLMQSVDIRLNDLELKKVCFVKESPIVEIIKDTNGVTFKNELDVILCKHISWKYEKEVRLYGYLSSVLGSKLNLKRVIPFDVSSIRGIILGSKISEQDISLLVKLIQNRPEMKDIKWYSAQKDLYDLKMNIVERKYFFLKKEFTVIKVDNSLTT